MSQQSQHRSSDHGDDAPEPVAATNVQASADARDEAVDALLDEIDGVLEQNAESFVRGFVQKGGQ